jgi:hypothetical protein
VSISSTQFTSVDQGSVMYASLALISQRGWSNCYQEGEAVGQFKFDESFGTEWTSAASAFTRTYRHSSMRVVITAFAARAFHSLGLKCHAANRVAIWRRVCS